MDRDRKRCVGRWLIWVATALVGASPLSGCSSSGSDGDSDADSDADWDCDADRRSDADVDLPDGDADGGDVDTDVDHDADADPPEWGFCTVGDLDGVCIDVAECTTTSTPGHCPGPANIQCCTDVPTGDCDPDAMPQPNMGLVELPGIGGCPAGMIAVDTFCIDRFEASLVEVHGDGTTTAWSPYWNPGTIRVRALSLEGAVPQGYITGHQAQAACEEAGKRLCTDDEWLRACRGPSSTTYPYGETRIDGLCNDARAVHPVVEYFGTSADWIWSELGHPCISQLPASLDRTGDNAGCVTAEGIFDMMGNLHEWTADPSGTFRGGFYVDTYRNGEGCLYRTTAHNRGHWDYSTGFRCCAE